MASIVDRPSGRGDVRRPGIRTGGTASVQRGSRCSPLILRDMRRACRNVASKTTSRRGRPGGTSGLASGNNSQVSSPLSGVSSNGWPPPYGSTRTLLSSRVAKRPVLLVSHASWTCRTSTISVSDRRHASSEHRHASVLRKQRGQRPFRSRGVLDRKAVPPTTAWNWKGHYSHPRLGASASIMSVRDVRVSEPSLLPFLCRSNFPCFVRRTSVFSSKGFGPATRRAAVNRRASQTLSCDLVETSRRGPRRMAGERLHYPWRCVDRFRRTPRFLVWIRVVSVPARATRQVPVGKPPNIVSS